ncbi:Os01g0296166 [Oryza sativa Japonica Group]|uniref:Os01g0296166 protein n=1 Tax=Oryza sativa subsp. japonica TaxID=39947 RepID=A0A0P0V220_ORYSJ|nr:Os01g0296166 [Oryza sativa Japonica Group]
MMMGLRTASILTFSNATADTEPDPPCHVLMRTPLSECRITAFRTVTFATHALVPAFPRLPMLMPCPGPQVTFSMWTLSVPAPMETQSSPLETTVLVMRTSEVFSTWMPSVLGLSAGELMDRPSTRTPLQLSNRKWNSGLFCTLSPRTVTLLLMANRIACKD